jgi:hypothetical protein
MSKRDLGSFTKEFISMSADCEWILSRDKEDEQKIARCSQSYIEQFFVKSDAVAGQKTPQDAGILMNSLVNRSFDCNLNEEGRAPANRR